jgi:hypothetical protein
MFSDVGMAAGKPASKKSLKPTPTETEIPGIKGELDKPAVVNNLAPPPEQIGTLRRIKHTGAYKPRTELGEYIAIKVTPPEKRGAKGRVAVEIYNFSKKSLSLVDFWIVLLNRYGQKVEAHVTADDFRVGTSTIRWIEIPGKGEIPTVDDVKILNMNMYQGYLKPMRVPWTLDLIKD